MVDLAIKLGHSILECFLSNSRRRQRSTAIVKLGHGATRRELAEIERGFTQNSALIPTVTRTGRESARVVRPRHRPPSGTTTRAPDDGKGRFTFVSETQLLAGDDGREGCASTGGAGWCKPDQADKCRAKEVAVRKRYSGSEKAANFLPDRGPGPGEEGWEGEASGQPLFYNMVRPVQRRRCRSSHKFVTRQMGLRLSLTLALTKGISSRLFEREVERRDVHETEPRSPSL
ncbi:hypothetical protein CKAN_02734800 [Cinnamomum micranthum f. kanehirae]|uniref:Uncharacterized protein n=1 Tax=Cinnamomum micranthum f. kanehirae TaxID=337451 RepID=A0A3S3NSK7_9MAGN|nr:hypothetical protein CKAN_02734800 [Cinnamomum micranthum f. kanehirae]